MGQEDSPLRVHRALYLGVPGAILSCGLTHNASLAASCSSNNKVLLWDVNAGRCVGSLDGHTADVTSCSFGKELLASGSRDGSIFLWKYKVLKRASQIKVHSAAINTCAISPDCQFLASGSEDKTIRIFKIRGGDGEFIQGPANKELRGHKDGVTDVNFSADSAALVSASADGSIKIWDTVTGELLIDFEGEVSDGGKVDRILKARFSSDCNHIVSLTRKCVKVWNVGKRKVSWEIKDEQGFQSIACHPTENTFIAVFMDGSIATYSINGKSELSKKPSDHRGPILSCGFAANGEMAITGGIDGKVLVWT